MKWKNNNNASDHQVAIGVATLHMSFHENIMDSAGTMGRCCEHCGNDSKPTLHSCPMLSSVHEDGEELLAKQCLFTLKACKQEDQENMVKMQSCC